MNSKLDFKLVMVLNIWNEKCIIITRGSCI